MDCRVDTSENRDKHSSEDNSSCSAVNGSCVLHVFTGDALKTASLATRSVGDAGALTQKFRLHTVDLAVSIY